MLKAFGPKPPVGIHAIITMRSDHLGGCAQFTGLAELVNRTQHLLPRMNKRELIRAIREPARLFGSDLALRMIDESQNDADALPLIQHCLIRMWQGHRPRADLAGLAEAPGISIRHESSKPAPDWVLTDEGYTGLQPILSEHADEVLREFTKEKPEAEHVTEHLFRALTEVDAENRGIRNPLRLSRLVPITGKKLEILDRVIDRFAQKDYGFLTRSSDEDPLIDISHEALIRCWTRLNNPKIDKETRRPKGWLQREQEDGRLWRSLLVQAESGEEISVANLDECQAWLDDLRSPAWAERHEGGWDDVQDLMARSRDAREAARRREEADKEREEAQKQLDRKIRRGLAVAVGLFPLLGALAGVFWYQAESAAKEAQLGDSLFRANQERQQLRDGY